MECRVVESSAVVFTLGVRICSALNHFLDQDFVFAQLRRLIPNASPFKLFGERFAGENTVNSNGWHVMLVVSDTGMDDFSQARTGKRIRSSVL